jgi:hypothetical protein
VPYSDVSDTTWDKTMVHSWRWGTPKPLEKEQGFSPMQRRQFTELTTQLMQDDGGLEYIWIDWCCVPQYSSSPMVEILRSKVFYVRARAMVIVPTYNPIPAGGIVRALLGRTVDCLGGRRGGDNAAQCGAAAAVIRGILQQDEVAPLPAGREYFSRVWTLMERVARYGRSERLCNWLSLEAWLGMVVDAMLQYTDEDPTASPIYKNILGKEAADLLDSILGLLPEAVQTGSAVDELDEKVAGLFEMVVTVWQSELELTEEPTKRWLLSYLEGASMGVYQATKMEDSIWAVYSYFYMKQRDQLQPSELVRALKNLVTSADALRGLMLELARKLDVAHLVPAIEEMDKRLLTAVKRFVKTNRQQHGRIHIYDS